MYRNILTGLALQILFSNFTKCNGDNYETFLTAPDINYKYYNVGVLMASHLDSPFDLERCGPAVDLALEEVNDRFLSQHRIKLRKVQASYPSCSGARAPGLAADMHFRDDVIAFVGPACMFALEPVARLAAYWNTPIITGMGDQVAMTDDLMNDPIIRYVDSQLKSYSDECNYILRKNLEYGLKKLGLLTFVRELDGNDDEDHDNYLRDASMYARVLILSVRGALVRKFMLSAHDLGMTKGDWTFLDVEIFKGSYWGDHDWETGDKYDSKARKAYEALLRVSLLQPTSDKFQDFSDKVKERAQLDYNYTISDGEEVNFVIGAFYDGVYLLGMALNETIVEGEDIRDGLAITRRMWNRDFHGITGHVRIDDNGDRDADYSILDLDPITGKFEVVAHYYGLHKKYSTVQGQKIHWPGGREDPPPDVPKCGFMGNHPDCKDNENYYHNIKTALLIIMLTKQNHML
ncbi:guanylyl cyclase [Holotrichia oblita]|uniref:Guanylyl cyclase n=1 Tax=Holotrichia oblita TaxID=644536 RepID=A0ACB9TIW6_HOLOL|nr:guanylyl cyclase [Holotrichia oblita]